jgi:hypothetical protein
MSTEFDRETALRLAIRALSINYRFGCNDQNVLQIIDTDCCLLILAATVDGPNANAYAMVEKKTSDGTPTLSTTPGSVADSPITDPAAATCG